MNKKGFTLVELLGVITILVLIFLLVFPSVQNIVDQGRDTVSQKQINTILNSSYDWSLKHIKKLPESNSKTFLTLSDLKTEGLIDYNITDPNTNEAFPNNLVISIENVGSKYKNTNKYSKHNGDYLYTIELDSIDSTKNTSKRPTISLEGLTPNSSGNYVTILNYNDTYTEVNYTAKSSNDLDLTDKVTIIKLCDGNIVDEINTTESRIYKISYTVVDEEGYSTTVNRSIIVADNEPPEITLPKNNTISTSALEFNLMKGVSCADNSGECEITTSGNITFGVPGKYIIEYTAKDPSGNTKTVKRVITVE